MFRRSSRGTVLKQPPKAGLSEWVPSDQSNLVVNANFCVTHISYFNSTLISHQVRSEKKGLEESTFPGSFLTRAVTSATNNTTLFSVDPSVLTAVEA